MCRKKILSLTIISDGDIFLEVRRSNKIETVQYFIKKNAFLFYKLVLGFKAKTKSHEGKLSRKITGPLMQIRT
jgi:hypothetical protein